MRISLAILGVFNAFLFTASVASAQNIWAQVKGGSWEPQTDTIGEIKGKIETYVKANTSRKVRDWSAYTFQYQGREETGLRYIFLNRRYVFISAFCGPIKDPESSFPRVADVGSCLFELRYDPNDRQFYGLYIMNEGS